MRALLMAMAVVLLFLAGCSIPAEVTTPAPAEVVFSPQDRQRIVDFYADYAYPPALAEPSIVAPDLTQRLEITARVPPDIAATPLPLALEKQLSPLPSGYERFRAGDAVYLMDVRIRQVIDRVAIPL